MQAILSTIFVAMLPVSELRGAVPMAMGVYGLSAIEAYMWAVLGNMIPVFFLLGFLPKVSDYMRSKWRWADKFFNWLFLRTRKRTEKGIKKYGAVALVLFVAVPLPLTGAWTGSVAAFLFGIKPKKALALIFLGVLIAGALVTLGTMGVIRIGGR